MTLSLPSVKFVHPQALYRNSSERTGANPYKLPFDVKLEAKYTISELLKVRVEVTDSMLGDFSKDLSAMIEGLANFAYDSIIGEEPELPADDTKNIANPENYYPLEKDFKFGGRLFTNPTEDPEQLAKSIWSYNFGLAMIKELYNNWNWAFEPVFVINDWLFNTRNVKADTIWPAAA